MIRFLTIALLFLATSAYATGPLDPPIPPAGYENLPVIAHKVVLVDWRKAITDCSAQGVSATGKARYAENLSCFYSWTNALGVRHGYAIIPKPESLDAKDVRTCWEYAAHEEAHGLRDINWDDHKGQRFAPKDWEPSMRVKMICAGLVTDVKGN